MRKQKGENAPSNLSLSFLFLSVSFFYCFPLCQHNPYHNDFLQNEQRVKVGHLKIQRYQRQRENREEARKQGPSIYLLLLFFQCQIYSFSKKQTTTTTKNPTSLRINAYILNLNLNIDLFVHNMCTILPCSIK